MHKPAAFLLLLLVFAMTSAAGHDTSFYAWRTFSGHPGGIGNADGFGSAARFYFPYGLAISARGELYVADTFNNTIRKMTTNGAVSTLAGKSGEAGSTDAIGVEARFSSPSSVALDAAGNVYVADTGNNTVRKISPDGAVITLAGASGQSGSANGTNGAARFNEPYGIAVDDAGNVFVSDSANSTIRKISSDGVVTTFAGIPNQSGSNDGTNQTARFSYPAGLAFDAVGNLYVADLNNSAIRKVSSAGIVTTFAGTAGQPGNADGTNGAAEFLFPSSVAVDSLGNVFVTDTFNCTIRKISDAGVVTTIAGAPEQPGTVDGSGADARFSYPSGIAADANGNLYLADTDNSAIRKIAEDGHVSTLAGSIQQPGSADAAGYIARFNSPFGVAAGADENAYVADTANHTIRKITRSGLVSTVAGVAMQSGGADGTNDAARFNMPYAVALDSAGNVFVADTFNKTIRRMTSNGVVTTLAGSPGQSGAQDGTNQTARFAFPIGIATDENGNVYVSDFLNRTIRKISGGGIVTTFAGSAGQTGSADGTNGVARFAGPFCLATDHDGNVFVSDSGNHTIRKISSSGVVTTLAGSAGQSGSDDGTNDTARFNAPAGIAADEFGNLYVADVGNSAIRKVTSAGVVTTLAGKAGQPGNKDGTNDTARFVTPAGISMTGNGYMLITDATSHTIREVTTNGIVTTLAGVADVSGSTDVVPDAASFYSPSAVAVNATGELLVADTYNNTIRVLTQDGAVRTLAGLAGQSGSADGTGSSARFAHPFGLGADSAGNIFVADSYNHTIRKITREGVVTTIAGNAGSAGSTDGTGDAARFSYPSGITVDSAGNSYVCEFDNATIRKIASNGLVTTLAGSAGQLGSDDGVGDAARFWHPNGIALDATGNLYVADSGNATVRKVTSAGMVATIAGRPGQRGGNDGQGDAARFDYPFGVAVDGAGNIYVADSGNSTLRKIDANRMVTTIGGVAGVFGGREGVGASATFAGPTGIAVDADGRIYVADSGNNRVVKGALLPTLRILGLGSQVRLSWTSPSSGFVLQQNSDLHASSAWSSPTNIPTDDGTNKSVIIESDLEKQFFRLYSD